jgi:hypothetical protein
MPPTATRPPYQPGDTIRALYFGQNPAGTTLGPVEVTAIEPRNDGRWHIAAKHPDTGQEIGYTVNGKGTSDSVSGREPKRELLDGHRVTLLGEAGWDERGLLCNDPAPTLRCLREDLAGADPDVTGLLDALRAAIAFVESRRSF